MNIKNLFRKKTTDYIDFEYCPNCDANLTMQKGYSNTLPQWVCKGCGQMLINPNLETESDIIWICDKCEATLNIQPGFSENIEEWKCTECGFLNKIDPGEVYRSKDEYQVDNRNPYKGLSDDEILELSMFEEIGTIDGRSNVILIRDKGNDRYYVKKLLTTYDRSIYDYLKDHPVGHMPSICGVYESLNCLIVIEEYIAGRTIADILEETDNDLSINERRAIHITECICDILCELHNLPTPIVHRDIKPSNVMLTSEGEVFLLDMNVAKWYDPEKTDDTRYMGTQNYAAPEQVGYGLSASSAKSDIYALGMLMNVMITGKFPKETKANGAIWSIIEKCISLDANVRYTASELKTVLRGLLG